MYLNVILPLNVSREYLYQAQQKQIEVGSCVKVEFGNSCYTGVVSQILQDAPNASYTIKEVMSVIGDKYFCDKHIKLLRWISKYYFCNIGIVLKSSIVSEIESTKILACTENAQKTKNKTHKKVLDFLHKLCGASILDLLDCGIRKSTIKKMLAEGLISYQRCQSQQNGNLEMIPDLKLSPEQEKAFTQIKNDNFRVYLLDGITGSGKTAVYISEIIKILNQDKNAQVLIMLPEISLTIYFLDKIKSHFHDLIQITRWDSGLTQSKKNINWHKIASGRSRIIIGARSSIFLPIPNLKLIVVDEEHDSSFKQDQGQFIYNARDIAIMRAKIFDIPVVLSSATPALEVMHNALCKKYVYLKLANRFGGAKIPKVQIIDMKNEKKVTKYFSATLYQALKENLKNGMQSLLFLNKRGYAKLILCQSCGHRIKCPNCSTWMSEHKKKQILLCHLCCFQMEKPKTCSQCQSQELISFGPGIEKIEEEVKELFTGCRVAAISSDTQVAQSLEMIEKGQIDIIVGTQIVSKGYDFANLTLLAVIDADSGMQGQDLRCNEKKFQILQQAIGRVGRRKLAPGRVVLQAYKPDDVILEALQKNDRDLFYLQEISNRKKEFMPPFSRLVGIIMSGFAQEEVQFYCKQMIKNLDNQDQVQVFGPAPAPIEFLASRYRYRFLIVANKKYKIHEYIKNWITKVDIPKKIKVQIDVDPINFL